jgi:hypothetical protein
MEKTYAYGPLKSNYFTQFEKMWIEGYCKEREIVLTESNLSTTLLGVAVRCPKSIEEKIAKLCKESEIFSIYSKTLFEKTWNNILGYSMNVVKPSGTINENQIESLKKSSKFWLVEAPKILSEELKFSCFKSVITQCLSEDGNTLEELKKFNPGKPSKILESIKKNFSYDVIQVKYPPLRINPIEIKKNESVLNMIPENDKLIGMITWTAEGVLLLKNK